MSDLFTPKSFLEISADMIERMRASTDRVTDYNVGSIVRSLLEAGAVELDDYYQEMYFGILNTIPVAIYQGFGFELQPATTAAGEVVITRGHELVGDVTISAGTEFLSSHGQLYRTDATVVLEAAMDSVTLPIYAVTPGSLGNAGIETLRYVNPISGTTASNPDLISGGADEETAQSRAERFSLFIQSLSRGTVAALRYAATLAVCYDAHGNITERVQSLTIQEVPGKVWMTIHNGSYGASPELISKVAKIVEGYEAEDGGLVGGYRAAGVELDVRAMETVLIDVDLELSLGRSAVKEAVYEAVRDAVARVLIEVEPGGSVRPIELVTAALGITGVASADIRSPTETVALHDTHNMKLGAFAVSWVD